MKTKHRQLKYLTSYFAKILLRQKFNLVCILACIFFFLCYFENQLLADELKGSALTGRSAEPDYPRWEKIYPGVHYSRIPITSVSQILKSELYLLKINPELATISSADAPSAVGRAKSDVRSLVKAKGGIAGINANFFDQQGKPLGVLVVDTERISSLHRGGKLLTGIFQIRNGVPSIVNREDFEPEMLSIAIQAGPRLVVGGKAVSVSSPEQKSRRSGVAITSEGMVLFYATLLRFPGASLLDIQTTLLGSGLGVTDVLNLDGGGSSQLFFVRDAENKTGGVEEVFVTGGDYVPSALIVLPKRP